MVGADSQGALHALDAERTVGGPRADGAASTFTVRLFTRATVGALRLRFVGYLALLTAWAAHAGANANVASCAVSALDGIGAWGHRTLFANITLKGRGAARVTSTDD